MQVGGLEYKGTSHALPREHVPLENAKLKLTNVMRTLWEQRMYLH